MSAQAQTTTEAVLSSYGTIVYPGPEPTPDSTPVPTVTPTSTPVPTVTPTSTPVPTPSSNPENLAVLPDDWDLTFGSLPQFSFLDTSVTYYGMPSIRLESDSYNYREVDGNWYSVKPGDHIVVSCWIKTDNDPAENDNILHGARIGFDLYGVTEGGMKIIDSWPHYGAEHIASVVRWNTQTWTHKTWDIIIPSTYYTVTTRGESIAPTQISSIVLWLDARPYVSAGNAYFANTELYINP